MVNVMCDYLLFYFLYMSLGGGPKFQVFKFNDI